MATARQGGELRGEGYSNSSRDNGGELSNIPPPTSQLKPWVMSMLYITLSNRFFLGFSLLEKDISSCERLDLLQNGREL